MMALSHGLVNNEKSFQHQEIGFVKYSCHIFSGNILPELRLSKKLKLKSRFPDTDKEVREVRMLSKLLIKKKKRDYCV